MRAALLKSCFRYSLFVAAAFAAVSPASAERLYSAWRLIPVSGMGEVDVPFRETFAEQKLIPFKLVRLSAETKIADKKFLPEGTYLFAVYQEDGKQAFCPAKNQSLGNAAKSLFIPMFNKRPCLVDANADGKFEATFSVYDKYGSALTPSGDLSSAKPLPVAAAYDEVEPELFPESRRFLYAFFDSGKKRPTIIYVRYQNGEGFSPLKNIDPMRVPNAPRALNLVAYISEQTETRIKANVVADSQSVIVGDSGGSFKLGILPDVIK